MIAESMSFVDFIHNLKLGRKLIIKTLLKISWLQPFIDLTTAPLQLKLRFGAESWV